MANPRPPRKRPEPRILWRGVIQFGAHTVPVKLIPGVRPAARVHLHLLHGKDRARLVQEMMCPVEDQPVPRAQRVKGYEIEAGRYVVVDEQELEALAPEGSRMIECMRVVDPRRVDPRYLDRLYFLAPDGGGNRFQALGRALLHGDDAGICRWVMRGHTYLGLLRLEAGRLLLCTLRSPEALIPVPQLERRPAGMVNARDLQTARLLIERMASPLHPDVVRSDYQERLRALIDRKARGEAVSIPGIKKRRPTSGSGLRAALAASLKRADAGRGNRAHGDAAGR